MDLLGVGPTEAILVIIIALVVFGPRRLPEIAVQAAKYYRQLRNLTQDVMSEWQREFQVEEFRKIQEEIKGEAKKVSDSLPTGEIKQMKKDVQSQVENTVSAAKPTKLVKSNRKKSASPKVEPTSDGDAVNGTTESIETKESVSTKPTPSVDEPPTTSEKVHE